MAFFFWDKDVWPTGFDAEFGMGEQHAILCLSERVCGVCPVTVEMGV